jgi:hypothetical protein
MNAARTRIGKGHAGKQAYQVRAGIRGLRNARRRLLGADAAAPEMVAGPAIGNLAEAVIGAALNSQSAEGVDSSSGREHVEGPMQPPEE